MLISVDKHEIKYENIEGRDNDLITDDHLHKDNHYITQYDKMEC